MVVQENNGIGPSGLGKKNEMGAASQR